MSNDDSCLFLSIQYVSGMVVSAVLVLTHLNMPKPSEVGAVLPVCIEQNKPFCTHS